MLPRMLCETTSRGQWGGWESSYGVCSSAGCCPAACRPLRWPPGGGWGRCGRADAEPRAPRRCCCCRRSPKRWPSRRSCCCRCCSSARSPPPQRATLPAATHTFTLDWLARRIKASKTVAEAGIWSSGRLLELLTSLDVIQLRLGGGVVLRGWGGFGADPRLDGGSEHWAGLVGANWLLLDPGLDLAAALSPKTEKTCHPESPESLIRTLHLSLPGFLNLDAAAQLLQHKFPSIMVDDEHAVLLVRTLVSFENCHGRRRTLEGKQREWARPT